MQPVRPSGVQEEFSDSENVPCPVAYGLLNPHSSVPGVFLADVLRDHFSFADCLTAPFRNRRNDVAGPLIWILLPNDLLGFGYEVAGHEFQGELCVSFEILQQFVGIVSLQKNLRSPVGLPVSRLRPKTFDNSKFSVPLAEKNISAIEI